MRISDWSSDVCSSDLGAGGTQAARPLRRSLCALSIPGPRADSLERTRILKKPWRKPQDPKRHFDKARARNYDRRKIGRASCRERVCQYVLISVVGVALKNKKTIHKRSNTTHNK